MTPQRQAYFDKCSKRELTLRAFIADTKIKIKKLKRDLKSAGSFASNVDLILIRYEKIRLSAYRHELARLKGMDRVATPYEIYDKSTDLDDWYCSNCDREVLVFDGYCPNCGRRILWEKVK